MDGVGFVALALNESVPLAEYFLMEQIVDLCGACDDLIALPWRGRFTLAAYGRGAAAIVIYNFCSSHWLDWNCK